MTQDGDKLARDIRAGLDLASTLSCDVPITPTAQAELKAAYDALTALTHPREEPRHVHQPVEFGSEKCVCGQDLRNPIHLRAEERP